MITNERKIYLILCIINIISQCSGLVEFQKSNISDNVLLLKVLQSIDTASSDAYLLDVTLKLLQSVCACMHETLHKKQKIIIDDTNSLHLEDEKELKNDLELYKQIYNNTCIDLRQELLNKIQRNELTSNHVFKQQLSHDENHYIDDKTKALMKRTIFGSLIRSQGNRIYRIEKHSLFNKKNVSKDNLRRRIIIIITLYTFSNETIDEITENEINHTLLKNMPIDIDIINTVYLPQNRKNSKVITAKKCDLFSIYIFLVESLKRDAIKVFKFLRRKGTIKIYIDAVTYQQFKDFPNPCCENNTLIECKNRIIYEHIAAEKVVQTTSDKNEMLNYKDIVSKIKLLVKQYNNKINRNDQEFSKSTDVLFATLANKNNYFQYKSKNISEEQLKTSPPVDRNKIKSSYNSELTNGTQLITSTNIPITSSKKHFISNEISSVPDTGNILNSISKISKESSNEIVSGSEYLFANITVLLNETDMPAYDNSVSENQIISKLTTTLSEAIEKPTKPINIYSNWSKPINDGFLKTFKSPSTSMKYYNTFKDPEKSEHLKTLKAQDIEKIQFNDINKSMNSISHYTEELHHISNLSTEGKGNVSFLFATDSYISKLHPTELFSQRTKNPTLGTNIPINVHSTTEQTKNSNAKVLKEINSVKFSNAKENYSLPTNVSLETPKVVLHPNTVHVKHLELKQSTEKDIFETLHFYMKSSVDFEKKLITGRNKTYTSNFFFSSHQPSYKNKKVEETTNKTLPELTTDDYADIYQAKYDENLTTEISTNNEQISDFNLKNYTEKQRHTRKSFTNPKAYKNNQLPQTTFLNNSNYVKNENTDVATTKYVNFTTSIKKYQMRSDNTFYTVAPTVKVDERLKSNLVPDTLPEVKTSYQQGTFSRQNSPKDKTTMVKKQETRKVMFDNLQIYKNYSANVMNNFTNTMKNKLYTGSINSVKYKTNSSKDNQYTNELWNTGFLPPTVIDSEVKSHYMTFSIPNLNDIQTSNTTNYPSTTIPPYDIHNNKTIVKEKPSSEATTFYKNDIKIEMTTPQSYDRKDPLSYSITKPQILETDRSITNKQTLFHTNNETFIKIINLGENDDEQNLQRPPPLRDEDGKALLREYKNYYNITTLKGLDFLETTTLSSTTNNIRTEILFLSQTEQPKPVTYRPINVYNTKKKTKKTVNLALKVINSVKFTKATETNNLPPNISLEFPTIMSQPNTVKVKHLGIKQKKENTILKNLRSYIKNSVDPERNLTVGNNKTYTPNFFKKIRETKNKTSSTARRDDYTNIYQGLMTEKYTDNIQITDLNFQNYIDKHLRFTRKSFTNHKFYKNYLSTNINNSKDVKLKKPDITTIRYGRNFTTPINTYHMSSDNIFFKIATSVKGDKRLKSNLITYTLPPAYTNYRQSIFSHPSSSLDKTTLKEKEKTQERILDHLQKYKNNSAKIWNKFTSSMKNILYTGSISTVKYKTSSSKDNKYTDDVWNTDFLRRTVIDKEVQSKDMTFPTLNLSGVQTNNITNLSSTIPSYDININKNTVKEKHPHLATTFYGRDIRMEMTTPQSYGFSDSLTSTTYLITKPHILDKNSRIINKQPQNNKTFMKKINLGKKDYVESLQRPPLFEQNTDEKALLRENNNVLIMNGTDYNITKSKGSDFPKTTTLATKTNINNNDYFEIMQSTKGKTIAMVYNNSITNMKENNTNFPTTMVKTKSMPYVIKDVTLNPTVNKETSLMLRGTEPGVEIYMKKFEKSSTSYSEDASNISITKSYHNEGQWNKNVTDKRNNSNETFINNMSKINIRSTVETRKDYVTSIIPHNKFIRKGNIKEGEHYSLPYFGNQSNLTYDSTNETKLREITSTINPTDSINEIIVNTIYNNIDIINNKKNGVNQNTTINFQTLPKMIRYNTFMKTNEIFIKDNHRPSSVPIIRKTSPKHNARAVILQLTYAPYLEQNTEVISTPESAIKNKLENTKQGVITNSETTFIWPLSKSNPWSLATTERFITDNIDLKENLRSKSNMEKTILSVETIGIKTPNNSNNHVKLSSQNTDKRTRVNKDISYVQNNPSEDVRNNVVKTRVLSKLNTEHGPTGSNYNNHWILNKQQEEKFLTPYEKNEISLNTKPHNKPKDITHVTSFPEMFKEPSTQSVLIIHKLNNSSNNSLIQTVLKEPLYKHTRRKETNNLNNLNKKYDNEHVINTNNYELKELNVQTTTKEIYRILNNAYNSISRPSIKDLVTQGTTFIRNFNTTESLKKDKTKLRQNKRKKEGENILKSSAFLSLMSQTMPYQKKDIIRRRTDTDYKLSKTRNKNNASFKSDMEIMKITTPLYLLQNDDQYVKIPDGLLDMDLKVEDTEFYALDKTNTSTVYPKNLTSYTTTQSATISLPAMRNNSVNAMRNISVKLEKDLKSMKISTKVLLVEQNRRNESLFNNLVEEHRKHIDKKTTISYTTSINKINSESMHSTISVSPFSKTSLKYSHLNNDSFNSYRYKSDPSMRKSPIVANTLSTKILRLKMSGDSNLPTISNNNTNTLETTIKLNNHNQNAAATNGFIKNTDNIIENSYLKAKQQANSTEKQMVPNTGYSTEVKHSSSETDLGKGPKINTSFNRIENILKTEYPLLKYTSTNNNETHSDVKNTHKRTSLHTKLYEYNMTVKKYSDNLIIRKESKNKITTQKNNVVTESVKRIDPSKIVDVNRTQSTQKKKEEKRSSNSIGHVNNFTKSINTTAKWDLSPFITETYKIMNKKNKIEMVFPTSADNIYDSNINKLETMLINDRKEYSTLKKPYGSFNSTHPRFHINLNITKHIPTEKKSLRNSTFTNSKISISFATRSKIAQKYNTTNHHYTSSVITESLNPLLKKMNLNVKNRSDHTFSYTDSQDNNKAIEDSSKNLILKNEPIYATNIASNSDNVYKKNPITKSVQERNRIENNNARKSSESEKTLQNKNISKETQNDTLNWDVTGSEIIYNKRNEDIEETSTTTTDSISDSGFNKLKILLVIDKQIYTEKKMARGSISTTLASPAFYINATKYIPRENNNLQNRTIDKKTNATVQKYCTENLSLNTSEIMQSSPLLDGTEFRIKNNHYDTSTSRNLQTYNEIRRQITSSPNSTYDSKNNLITNSADKMVLYHYEDNKLTSSTTQSIKFTEALHIENISESLSKILKREPPYIIDSGRKKDKEMEFSTSPLVNKLKTLLVNDNRSYTTNKMSHRSLSNTIASYISTLKSNIQNTSAFERKQIVPNTLSIDRIPKESRLKFNISNINQISTQISNEENKQTDHRIRTNENNTLNEQGQDVTENKLTISNVSYKEKSVNFIEEVTLNYLTLDDSNLRKQNVNKAAVLSTINTENDNVLVKNKVINVNISKVTNKSLFDNTKNMDNNKLKIRKVQYNNTPGSTMKLFRRSKIIKYNTYKPTERDLDIITNRFYEPLRNNFKNKYKTTNTPKVTSRQPSTTVISTKRVLHVKSNFSEGTVEPRPAKSHPESNVLNKKKVMTNDNSLLKTLENTKLYPIKKLPSKLQRKVLRRIFLPNKEKKIIAMNTEDFFSRRRAVPKNYYFHNQLQPYSKAQVEKPVTIKPRQYVIRPVFDQIDGFNLNDKYLRPKPLLIRKNDFSREEFQTHRRSNGLSLRHKVNYIRDTLPSPIERDAVTHVIERPAYLPPNTKPKFLRDRIDSIRNYLYHADFIKSTESPVNNYNRNTTEGVHYEDPLYYFRKSGWYDTGISDDFSTSTTAPKRTRRKRKTIFFLSPSVPYRYF